MERGQDKHRRSPQKLLVMFGVVAVGVLFLVQGIIAVTDNKIKLITPKRVLTVEQAKSEQERATGLSNRAELKGIDGMLFYFDTASLENCFWMKDTLLALDMVFLNTSREVVTIHENVKPETYPQTFCPTQAAQFGLEVPAGKASEWGIELGKKLTWQ